jgi:hypothetical protein
MAKRATSRTPKRSYNWKLGASIFHKFDAQAVGEEIETLRKKLGGSVDADAIVEAARDMSSAMHDAFPWDDEEAAKLHRLEVARRLLRSVTVVMITPERKEITVKAFLSTPTKGAPQKSTYTSTEYAMSDPELRSEVLKQALRELAALRRKYAELSELAVVFAAIDKIRKAA